MLELRWESGNPALYTKSRYGSFESMRMVDSEQVIRSVNYPPYPCYEIPLLLGVFLDGTEQYEKQLCLYDFLCLSPFHRNEYKQRTLYKDCFWKYWYKVFYLRDRRLHNRSIFRRKLFK